MHQMPLPLPWRNRMAAVASATPSQYSSLSLGPERKKMEQEVQRRRRRHRGAPLSASHTSSSDVGNRKWGTIGGYPSQSIAWIRWTSWPISPAPSTPRKHSPHDLHGIRSPPERSQTESASPPGPESRGNSEFALPALYITLRYIPY